MNKVLTLVFSISLFLLPSCGRHNFIPINDGMPIQPDYKNLENWVAHPQKSDPSDRSPDVLTKGNELLPVDVFFIYPTIYYGGKGKIAWNADVHDSKLNKKIESSTILFQASAFNRAGNVYSPRYRQAHLDAYFTNDRMSAKKAFEIAYSDVKAAFSYYLQNYNENKPFIIASHSQGTNHAERLIAEMIDTTVLRERFIAAYLVGMPIDRNRFINIPACNDSLSTGCFVSWRTFKTGHKPYLNESNICVTNPLSWTCDETYVSKENNPGSIFRDFEEIKPQSVDAKVEDNVLWATKPKFKGSIFFRRKNFHIADINFYYVSIRNNALARANIFWKRTNGS